MPPPLFFRIRGICMKITVYNQKTGKGCEVEAVDGREYVATGEWTYTEPGDKKKKSADKHTIGDKDQQL